MSLQKERRCSIVVFDNLITDTLSTERENGLCCYVFGNILLLSVWNKYILLPQTRQN